MGNQRLGLNKEGLGYKQIVPKYFLKNVFVRKFIGNLFVRKSIGNLISSSIIMDKKVIALTFMLIKRVFVFLMLVRD